MTGTQMDVSTPAVDGDAFRDALSLLASPLLWYQRGFRTSD